MEASLLLTFFLCLHYQLISVHSIVTLSLRFVLKITERPEILVKKELGIFKFALRLKDRLTITGNFGRFQSLNFEINYLKNENRTQKTGVRFFS